MINIVTAAKIKIKTKPVGSSKQALINSSEHHVLFVLCRFRLNEQSAFSKNMSNIIENILGTNLKLVIVPILINKVSVERNTRFA